MRTTNAPLARKEGLLVQELANEVLVYDQERDKAHCLNPTAAFVWQHCDGRTGVKEMARLMEKSLGTKVDEDVVWCALNQLEKDHLLGDQFAWPVNVERLSRRELMRRLGIGAAIVIPVVTSIMAPTAAHAGSACAPNITCNDFTDCPTGCSSCTGGICI